MEMTHPPGAIHMCLWADGFTRQEIREISMLGMAKDPSAYIILAMSCCIQYHSHLLITYDAYVQYDLLSLTTIFTY